MNSFFIDAVDLKVTEEKDNSLIVHLNYLSIRWASNEEFVDRFIINVAFQDTCNGNILFLKICKGFSHPLIGCA